MPKLERWEEKAIKRIPRYQNTASEVVVTKLVEGAKALAKGIVDSTVNKLRSKVDDWFTAPEAQEINGKEFRENFGVGQKVALKVGTVLAETALEKAGDAADAYLFRDYFYPSGKAVAKAAFSGSVTFDAEMSRQMYNACGYEPDFKAVLNGMYDTAAKVKPSLTDITWRKEVMPHMIRTAFQSELSKSFDAICQHHTQNPSILNDKLVEAHMNTAARHLSGIFEKFTLDLANSTEYLEAPMTFLPKRADLHEDVEMTPEERALLAEVSRHSLMENGTALQKQIAESVKLIPQTPLVEAYDTFKSELSKPMRTPDGQEVPYRSGMNSAEDSRRLLCGILNLRGMQQRYERRGFFNRLFSSDARVERRTIRLMKDYLHEITGVHTDALRSLLDPKTPLESNISLSEVLGIQPKEKTFSENVAEAMQNAGEAVSNAAGAIIDAVIQTGKAVGSATDSVLSGVAQVTYKAGEMVGSAAGLLWSGVKTVASYANPLNYFGWGSKQEQAPVNEEPEAAEAQDEIEEQPIAQEVPEVKEDPTALQMVQKKQLDLIKNLGTDPITSPNVYFGALSELIYLKTLEVSITNGALDEESARNNLSEESIQAGAKKIRSETAFHQLDVCMSKGISSRVKTFGKEINDDPSMVNAIHKNYVNNLQKLAQPQEAKHDSASVNEPAVVKPSAPNL